MKRQRMKHHPGKRYSKEEAAERKAEKARWKRFFEQMAAAGFSKVMVVDKGVGASRTFKQK